MTGLDAELKEHRGLVYAIARRLALRMPASVELDDLVQHGMIGLWDALRRFDPAAPDANFPAFASKRIRGAMLDAARNDDPIGRKVRTLVKAGARKRSELAHAGNARPLDSEVAAALGIAADVYRAALHDAHVGLLVPLEDLHDAEDAAATPFDHVLMRERMAEVERYCGRLKPKDSEVLRRLLVDGETMGEIAADFGVSGSAIGHRLRRILAQLNTLLEGS